MPENRRRFRDPVARSPLLRKGGPHQRSRSGERHQMHQALEAELDEWLKERETERQDAEPVSKGTGSSLLRRSATEGNCVRPNKIAPTGTVGCR